MKKDIAVLPGDGIGPEIMNACLPVLEKAADIGGHQISTRHGLVGWAAHDVYGDVMPEETWRICRRSDAILFGAVGLPKRDPELPSEMRPEKRALLPIRKEFNLGCNIRLVRVYPTLTDLSPIKNERLIGGVNLTFFRELIGGDYFGERRIDPNGQWAEDICRYDKPLIVNIARAAFRTAQKTKEKVTSIDKANVLGATGTFWRKIVQEVHDTEFREVALDHQFVDAFNLYLFTKPEEFQIVLCSNAHGDILSDGGAGLAGSMGLLPSASLDTGTGFGLYEPSGGSAPDIAGQNIANPIAMILSIALMFRHSLDDNETAVKIETAVEAALEKGFRTKDLAPENSDTSKLVLVGTTGMVFQVLDCLN